MPHIFVNTIIQFINERRLKTNKLNKFLDISKKFQKIDKRYIIFFKKYTEIKIKIVLSLRRLNYDVKTKRSRIFSYTIHFRMPSHSTV